MHNEEKTEIILEEKREGFLQSNPKHSLFLDHL